MFDRRLIGVITLSAALCLSADCVQAFDDATYPDLKGQWIRITPPGQPAFDPSKPRSRGQEGAGFRRLFHRQMERRGRRRSLRPA